MITNSFDNRSIRRRPFIVKSNSDSSIFYIENVSNYALSLWNRFHCMDEYDDRKRKIENEGGSAEMQ